jgi:hypothetical protein
MGAWGFGPFDNDGAMDWFDTKMSGEIRAVLRLAVANPDREYTAEARAAIRCAIMLCQDKIRVHDEVLDLAERFLLAALADKAARKAWNDPRAYEQELREELERVRFLRAYRGVQREFSAARRSTVVIETDAAGFPTRISRGRKKAREAQVIGKRVTVETERGPVSMYERVGDAPRTRRGHRAVKKKEGPRNKA